MQIGAAENLRKYTSRISNIALMLDQFMAQEYKLAKTEKGLFQGAYTGQLENIAESARSSVNFLLDRARVVSEQAGVSENLLNDITPLVLKRASEELTVGGYFSMVHLKYGIPYGAMQKE